MKASAISCIRTMSAFLALCCFGAFTSAAQDTLSDPAVSQMHERPKNDLSVGLLADGSYLSLNYERLLFINPWILIAGGMGIGYSEEYRICIFGSCTEKRKQFITFPHHLTGNFGFGKHFFEAGIGGAAIIGKAGKNYLIYPVIGYRFQPIVRENFTLRAFACYPVSGKLPDDFVMFPFGVNLGVSFGN